MNERIGAERETLGQENHVDSPTPGDDSDRSGVNKSGGNRGSGNKSGVNKSGGDRLGERSGARRAGDAGSNAGDLDNDAARPIQHAQPIGDEPTDEAIRYAYATGDEPTDEAIRNGDMARLGSDHAIVERANVTKWQTLHVGEDGIPRELEDEIASEYALTVVLNGEEFGTLVCSPTHQQELIYGFLASEGAIRSASQVKKLEIDDERGYAYVVLNGEPLISSERSSKRFVGSCCGKGRQFYFHGDMLTARTVMTRMTVTAEQVWALMARLQMSSTDFIRSGGVHNAALCTPDELLAVRTDIGRHNALDKLYGYSMLRNIRMADKLIAFSGRLSSEVVLKAAKMSCGLLLSKSAPTDLALKLADELGITCIGFIRGRRLSVYTHRERLIISGQLP